MNDPMEDFWKDRCMKAADEREGYRDKFLASEQRGDTAEALLRATVIERDQLQARVAELEADYSQVVGKFDECRAALARRVKADTGKEPTSPDDDSRPWHEWLIERSDAALQREPSAIVGGNISRD